MIENLKLQIKFYHFFLLIPPILALLWHIFDVRYPVSDGGGISPKNFFRLKLSIKIFLIKEIIFLVLLLVLLVMLFVVGR